jgi:hypothetical protein
MTSHSHRLMRTLASRHNDIEEWRLGDPALAAAKGYPREFRAEIIDDWGIVFLDLAIDAGSGELTCHEVNGPNAVGSDALTGDSSARARNEAMQAARRAHDLGLLHADGKLRRHVVTVHAHQHWAFFRTGGEFFPRVAQFAEGLEEFLPGNAVAVREAGEPFGAEQITVVFGEVPRVASGLSINQQDRFEFSGKPVIFAGNPNLLPELVRLGKVHAHYSAELGPAMRVLPAWRLTPIIHDKALQQRLLRGTGIRPQRHFEATSTADAMSKTREALRHHAVVLKPNGTSGGAGVHIVVPGMSDEKIRERIEKLLSDCRIKYGDNVEHMIFPLRGFEFIPSTAYPMAAGGHLWDLRIAVQFEPGKASAYPVSIRFAPKPFDPATFHDDRDQWISNVSGRQSTHLKSGMDDEVLNAVGLTPERMDLALKASVTWTLKAWDHSVRNGGYKDTVYEDEAERENPSFYPRMKFTA